MRWLVFTDLGFNAKYSSEREIENYGEGEISQAGILARIHTSHLT